MIDYLTLFRIGGRIRANVFTRLAPKDVRVQRLRGRLARPGVVFPELERTVRDVRLIVPDVRVGEPVDHSRCS